MLRLLGVQGAPRGTQVVIGAALVALGFWRHSTLALIVGGVVVVIGIFRLLGGLGADRGDGPRKGGR
jgi:hypothetical protein